MSNTNYPSATPQQESPKKDNKNLIIILLSIGIIASWAYLLYQKNESEKIIVQYQKENSFIDSSKTELEKSYNDALGRLDSLSTYNNELEGKLSSNTSEIEKLKGRIGGLMKKQRLSETEKKEAANLIKELNDKISGLEQEVARLNAENQQLNTDLTSEKEKTTQLTTDLKSTNSAKQELEKKVDVASTLNASNISITPIDERKGGKEKATATAKRVDKLVISFDVENRIAGSGTTNVYVCMVAPDGKPVAVEALGSGKFQTREEGEKLYTSKVNVDYEVGKKKHVEFAWKQNSAFQTGNYKIEVYHNGFKIGENVVVLKKGGLFS